MHCDFRDCRNTAGQVSFLILSWGMAASFENLTKIESVGSGVKAFELAIWLKIYRLARALG
jgi:hypothetical protein